MSDFVPNDTERRTLVFRALLTRLPGVHPLQDRVEESLAVHARAGTEDAVGPKVRLDRVLGVRHQAHHVALLVAHAGDVAGRAVRVRANITASRFVQTRQ